jgi:hypothetical protein
MPEGKDAEKAKKAITEWIEQNGEHVSLEFDGNLILAPNYNPYEPSWSLFPGENPIASAEITQPLNAEVIREYEEHDTRGPHIQFYNKNGDTLFCLESMPLLNIKLAEDYIILSNSHACDADLFYENDAQDKGTKTLNTKEIDINVKNIEGDDEYTERECEKRKGECMDLIREIRSFYYIDVLIQNDGRLRLIYTQKPYTFFTPCFFPQEGAVRELKIQGKGGARILIGDPSKYVSENRLAIPHATYVLDQSMYPCFSLFKETSPGNVKVNYSANFKTGFSLIDPEAFQSVKFTYKS